MKLFCIYSSAWFSAPFLDKWHLVMYICPSCSIYGMKKCIKELKFFREFPKYRAFYCFFQQRDFVQRSKQLQLLWQNRSNSLATDIFKGFSSHRCQVSASLDTGLLICFGRENTENKNQLNFSNNHQHISWIFDYDQLKYLHN